MIADETAIPLSRGKIALLILISVGFVALGAWLFTLPDAEILPRHDPLFVHGIAVASIAFFGLCGVLGFRRLFDRRLGLQLSSAGVTYATNGAASCFISWSDIADFDVLQVRSTRFIVAKLYDPQKYIAQGGRARQMLSQANMQMCGSPITISSGMLAIRFKDMEALFERYLTRYGAPPAA